MRATRGVTLTELLGCVAGMVCLIAVLTSALSDAKDAACRAACAANLAEIGTALRLYSQDWDGYLPDSGAASALGGTVPSDGRHFPSRFNAPGTCTWPKVRAVGNQANLWILVRDGYAAPGSFVCPAVSDRKSYNAENNSAVMGFLATDPVTGKPTAAESRFLKRVTAGHCSYSYQNQFAHPGISPEIADPRNATTRLGVHPADLAILADRNPYTRTDLVQQPVVSPADQPEANSLNHHGLGQNVLYLGSEVEWHETPCCGPLRSEGLRDNIYWPEVGQPDDPENVPRSIYDSYLVP